MAIQMAIVNITGIITIRLPIVVVRSPIPHPPSPIPTSSGVSQIILISSLTITATSTRIGCVQPLPRPPPFTHHTIPYHTPPPSPPPQSDTSFLTVETHPSRVTELVMLQQFLASSRHIHTYIHTYINMETTRCAPPLFRRSLHPGTALEHCISHIDKRHYILQVHRRD